MGCARCQSMGCGCQGPAMDGGGADKECPCCANLGCFTYKQDPGMGDLRDVPLPPNIDRPEMWDTGAVVRAVKDGFDFLLPFVSHGLFEPNAYWIKGRQASAFSLTVGPEHTPEIELIDHDWIRVKLYFRPEMVPKEAWLGPPNENGVVAVYGEIDPDTIDWDLLNRGHQIRVKGGF
jgi:hypothetical protein